MRRFGAGHHRTSWALNRARPHRGLSGIGAPEHAKHATQICEHSPGNIHARIRVFDPFNRKLVNTHAGTLCHNEELGVEEPSLITNRGQQLERNLRPYGFESTLRIAKLRVQHQPCRRRL